MSRCRPKVSRSSIAGNDWHTLDFGEIEKDLAAKLSDNDINDILLHINAADKLKRLRLTNCINITGAGLISLRGSTSIEQIDLSLVGANQSPILDPEPPISCDQVLPILDSIISQGRCSLKHLQFPHAWRNKEPEPDDTELNEFLERYDETCWDKSRTVCCSSYRFGLIQFDEDDNLFGMQSDTCCVCTKRYCSSCTDEDGNILLHFCQTCERNYCTECAAMVECDDCEDFLCVDCIPHTNCASPHCTDIVCKGCISKECQECNKKWCYSCHECRYCVECNERCCCVECSEKEGVNGVHWCDVCDSMLCDNCRLEECHNGDNNCKACVKMIAPLLAPLLMEENRQLRDKNEEVMDEIKNLTDDNELLNK
jgi:hypothetical protein